MDEPAAVPFRALSGETPEPVAKLAQIEDQLASIEDDFQPVGSIGPEVDLSFPELAHPFQERFDKEEIVIDRYASLEAETLRHRPRVKSREGQELGRLLAQHVLPEDQAIAVAEHPTQRIAPATPANSAQPHDDADIIVIEDALRGERPVPAPPAAKVRRQEYRQLFRQLRRGG
jgi:hypothetical protein